MVAVPRGNQNCHAEITFEDNVKWLARFRLQRTSSPPPEVRNWILRSEAATMTFLQRHTCIPVPKIFDWACESEPGNSLGVGYILVEKLDGSPLDWRRATPLQKEKLMRQLAGIFLEIEKHPFEAMGSLILSSKETIHFDVRGLADHSTFRVGKDHSVFFFFARGIPGHGLILTSIPAWRKTLRAGKNNRYFDFEQAKNFTHRDISQIFI